MAKPGRKPKQILKIGIDCGSLAQTSDNFMGGVATVVTNLILELKRIDKRNTYILYSYAPLPKDVQNLLNSRFRFQLVWPPFGYKTVGLPLVLQLTKPDIFLATSQAIPSGAPPTLGFIYDLAFLRFPKLYSQFEKLRKNTDTLVKKSRHILTISESSKNDIMSYYALSEEDVSVCYPTIDPIFTDRGTKFIDECPYFLFVGGLRPTKNVPLLLRAFFTVLRETRKKAKLILIGDITSMDPEIPKMIERLSLQKHVVIKGYVSKEDLAKYYRGTIATIVPSHYEGFGLPVVEAFASGTPVIAPNHSSLTEVMGKSGILVKYNDPKAISDAMQLVWRNAVLRNKLKIAGLKRAKEFSKRSFAKEILELVYEKCVGK